MGYEDALSKLATTDSKVLAQHALVDKDLRYAARLAKSVGDGSLHAVLHRGLLQIKTEERRILGNSALD